MKSNIWNVVSFSIMQNIKSKVFIILTLVCGLLMFILTPTMIYMSEEMTSTKDSTIKSVYVIDDNKILNNTGVIDKKGSKIKGFDDVKFYLVNKEFDTYKDEFASKKGSKNSLLIHATNKKNMYQLDMYKIKETDITENDLALFSEKMVSFYNDNKIENMKLDAKSHTLVNTPIKVDVHLEGQNDSDKHSETTVMMTVMMVIMFFIVLSGENISTQIVTEKSTKLVEYLLVNVRPLDLVCGKILASVIVSLIQILVMVGSGLLSIVFCKKIGIISSYEDTLTLLKLGEFTDEISAMDIALIVVFLVVGFLFYAIIMCMLSSTVSRLEDLSNAQMIFSVIIIVVMYSIMGIMTVNDMDTTQAIYKVLIMLPFTSVFVTPQLIMLGKISMSFVVIAVIAQIIFIVIFGKAAAKVYISLIMYSGKKLSIKQIWNIVKGSKVGEAHE